MTGQRATLLGKTSHRIKVLALIVLTLALTLGCISGCIGAAAPHPEISVSPSSLSMSTEVGSTSSQVATVTNAGASSIGVSQATVSGAGFSIVGRTLPVTLSPGQRESFTVTFAATTASSVDGSLSIMTDAQHQPIVVHLHGGPSTPGVSSVTLSPSSASLSPSGKMQFTATVQGKTTNDSVTWTASTGMITSSGAYTAPATPGFAKVTATSNADPTKAAFATVTVTTAPVPPPPSTVVTSVTVSPSTASSITTSTLPFTATVQGTTSNKTVTWKASLGSITTSGMYTAPANTGTATVTATSNADPTKSASAIVSVTAPPSPSPTPVSAMPLTISSVAVSGIGQTAATVTWTTNVAGDSRVGYAVSPSTSYTFTPCCNPTNVTAHAVMLTGLSSGTIYNFVVESTGGSPSATQESPVAQFTTSTVVVPRGNTILPALFSMDLGINSVNMPSHFPTVPFGSIRPSDPGIPWRTIEPSRGTYSWTELDKWLALANSQGKDILYTLGKTPQWASMRPDETCPGGSGCAAPPSDVDTGDIFWKEMVTALVQHSNASSTAKIHYYEIWNEADGGFWTGTDSQMATMAKDAWSVIHALDPSARVLAPSISSCFGTSRGFTWLSGYFAAGGAAANAQDIVSLHAYPSGTEPLEPMYLNTEIDQIRTLMTQYGIGSEEIAYTEGAWNGSRQTTKTSDQQVAFLAQQYLYMWAKGITRYYWFQWDNATFGTLWSNGTTLPPGVAYGQLYTWLVGSTAPANPCMTDSNQTWSCNLTLANGNPAEIVWNTNGALNFTVSPTFAHYQTLDTATPHTVSGGAVAIGNIPIMLTQ
jgi:hypothetical protein